MLRALQRCYRVYLGAFIDDPADEQYVGELQKICPDAFVARINRRSGAWRALTSLWRGEPATIAFYRSRQMSDWVASVAGHVALEKTVVFSSAMAQYAPRDVPLVVDFVDLDSEKWRKFAPAHRWPISWIYRREARELLSYERMTAKAADAVLFVTRDELDVFESRAPECRGRAHVLRNGVDAAYFDRDPDRPNPFDAAELPVVFTGTMDYWPNVDAVTWFVEDVLPMLRSRWPRARFYIVGRNPSRGVKALANDSVVVTGAVDDVRPFLQYAHAVVAPLRFGRGIQNKILEAMAMSQPVVTVPSCARAVGAHAAQGLFCAEDAAGFADTVGQLLERTLKEAGQLGAAARNFVLNNYQWETEMRALCQLVGTPALRGESQC